MHEERTARRTSGGEEDSGRCMRRGQQGGHREERAATMVAIKQGSITFKREVLIKRVVFSLKGRL